MVRSTMPTIVPGEAIVWPAGIVHGAWTEHSEMRAFVVEFAHADGVRPLEPVGSTAASGGSGVPVSDVVAAA